MSDFRLVYGRHTFEITTIVLLYVCSGVFCYIDFFPYLVANAVFVSQLFFMFSASVKKQKQTRQQTLNINCLVSILATFTLKQGGSN
jgi:Flp pilus assembly protein protease CpaA